jgi:quinol monooxygenase YgiN
MFILPIQSIESVNGKRVSDCIPSSPSGLVGWMRVKADIKKPKALTRNHQRRVPLAMLALLAAVLGFNPIARAEDASSESNSTEAIGLLVTLQARPGKEADAEAFLKSAQPLAQDEKGTLKWYAIKLGPGKFGIFDTFANEGNRNAHLTGEIAKALGARANELFAVAPQIEKVEVLASTPLKQSSPEVSAQDVPAPLSGALGQVQSVEDNSITIQNKAGLYHINITQPLRTYKVVPSDLNHITDNDYIGVASTQAPDGKEVAKQIFVFPSELRGAVEGSVLVDPQPGSTAQSRMTNGSVSVRRAAESHSRMTNGVVQKGNGTSLVVRYQDGEQTISVPAKVPVVGIVRGEVQLAVGETAYAKYDKQSDGALTTNIILVIGGPSSGKTR